MGFFEAGCSEAQWDLECYGDEAEDEMWVSREKQTSMNKKEGGLSVPKKKYPVVTKKKTSDLDRVDRVEKKCKWCKTIFYPRIADVKRGWGKFCSKSCKAKDQTRRTGVSGPTGVKSIMTMKTRIKAGMRTKQDRPLG